MSRFVLIFITVPQAYTKLKIFKRIEVWILLVLGAAGLVFVLLSRQEELGARDPGERGTRGEDPQRTVPPPADVRDSAFQAGGQLEVKGVRVNRTGREYLTEVGFSFDNQSEEPLQTFEEAKLITASGKHLPAFFLAFTGAPPELPAGQKSDATVRFRLGSEDIIGELSLDIGGQRQQIKSARSFDPEAIASRDSKSFDSTEW